MVILYWSLAFIVGSAIPQVQTISELVAAVCIMQFTYTFPPLFYTLFHMQLDASTNDPGDSWRDASRWRRALLGSFSLSASGSASGSGRSGLSASTSDNETATNGTSDMKGSKLKSLKKLAQLKAATPPARMVFYKVFNLVLFLGSLAMACLGMYGSGKAIQETFANGGAATSFGCGAPV